MYEEIAAPPFAPPVAVNVAAPLPNDRPVPTSVIVPVGACGTVVTSTAPVVVDAADVPEELVAVIETVTLAAEAIPGTTIGEDDPVADCPLLTETV